MDDNVAGRVWASRGAGILFTPTPNILSTPGVFTHPGGQAAD